jgi:hypothetical protein
MRGTPLTPRTFYGFGKGIEGRWLALPPRPSRQIEFIADSGTTGYGDLSTTVDCSDDESCGATPADCDRAVESAHIGQDQKFGILNCLPGSRRSCAVRHKLRQR